MKKILTLGFFLLCTGLFAQTADSLATIVFYRDEAFAGSALSFKIRDSLGSIIQLYNHSYSTHQCKPGEYRFSMKKDRASITLKVDAGEVYYCKASIISGFWKTTFNLKEVDSVKAKEALSKGEYMDMQKPLIRTKNRIAFGMSGGFGFSGKDIMKTSEGNNVSMSFGGGFGFGALVGRELSKHLDLELGYQFLASGLSPTIENGSMDFKRHIVSLTPSWIIPLDGGYAQRIKLGAGMDVYLGNTLDISTSKVPGGFADTWQYDDAFGFHVRALHEMNAGRHWLLYYGLKYYSVHYNFGSGQTYFPLDQFFIKPNGNGLNIVLGFGFRF